MRRAVAVVMLTGACAAAAAGCGADDGEEEVDGGGGGPDGGGPDGGDVDAAPEGPALVVPAVIAVPYVVAGAGGAMAVVEVRNPGSAPVGGPGGAGEALAWSIDGEGFSIVDAPATIEAGGDATLTVAWAGAAEPAIAGATLIVASEVGERAAEVWGVAGAPGLGEADFAPVVGAGGVTIGESVVVSMPTAPFPVLGGAWSDDRVHLFVPAGYRELDAHDLVLHFHGHNTTIDATVPGHHYREHVYASGANLILAVPQGPVEAASGDFGKLDDPAGTAAFFDEVLTVLYRAGRIQRPVVGDVTLTSHSGGYQAVAQNLGGDPPFHVAQVGLFDSLYGYVTTYRDYVLDGGWLRSNYTTSGGTDDNNLELEGALVTAGVAVASEPAQHLLRDAEALIYFTAASHNGATRDDGAYGEQLRWRARHSRRGPRIELRSAAVEASSVALRWFAPPDADVIQWRVETSADGAIWSVAALADPTAEGTQLDPGDAWVRVVPVVEGIAADERQRSDVYRVEVGAEVLIVDGFDRVVDGSWGGLAHDFAARVGAAVAGGVHTASNEAIVEDGFDLSPYRAVIWLLGDESVEDHTFTEAERAALEAYLDGGGRVVISGSEVGYELSGSADAAAWLARVVGAVYAADDAGTSSVVGAGPLADVGAFTFGGPDAPYAEEYPDRFTAAPGATVLLSYAGGAGAAAVGIAGRGALVGFPLELVDGDDELAAVLAALLAFLA